LAPFNLDQIKHSLRATDATTHAEILALARRDEKFREVMARPSLLYIVSVLWRREKLSERRRINSALVMELFIRRSLEHQKDKYDRPFMVLNSAERHYFMTRIAAYMAAKKLPNQINGHWLEEPWSDWSLQSPMPCPKAWGQGSRTRTPVRYAAMSASSGRPGAPRSYTKSIRTCMPAACW